MWGFGQAAFGMLFHFTNFLAVLCFVHGTWYSKHFSAIKKIGDTNDLVVIINIHSNTAPINAYYFDCLFVC